MKVNSRRRGFTITEVTICMIIIAILTFLSLNSNIAEHTAKQEAEKLSIWLTRITQKASRTRRDFSLEKHSDTILRVKWDNDSSKKEDFEAAPGFKFSINNNMTYNASTNGFKTYGTITVTRNDKNKHKDDSDKSPYEYHTVISSVGRIRTAETAPKQGNE